ncbi:MAG: transporter substrate-binding domain-containing protein [Vulcanimicrobiota bacterium]
MWILLYLWVLCLPAPAQSHLDEIERRGLLRVGTPGDYPPFSLATGQDYAGFDIDLARLAGRKLGVRVEWIASPWSNLLQDLGEDRYDMAVGGITRTLERARQAGFTRALVSVGKVALVRRGEKLRYDKPEKINQPQVRVASNPGGTNESYAREHFGRAQVILFQDNLSIPGRLARGEVDVFVTDSLEASRAVSLNPDLAVAAPPWTQETLGWMVPRADQAWLNWLNLFLEECECNGSLARLRSQHGI